MVDDRLTTIMELPLQLGSWPRFYNQCAVLRSYTSHQPRSDDLLTTGSLNASGAPSTPLATAEHAAEQCCSPTSSP